MKPVRIAVATAALVAVAGVGLSPASAQWWNPFRREAPAAVPQPLPPPPATITGVPGPAGAAQAGAPLQLPLPPATVGAAPATEAGAVAAPPAPVAAVPAGSPDLALRIDRIEAQMRTLTGQVEEIAHRMQILQQELAALSGGAPAPGQRAELPAATGGQPAREGLAEAATILRPAPARAAPAAAPGPGDRTVATTAAAGVPVDLRFPAQPAAVTMSGDPQRDYAAAYHHVLAGEYDLAEIGFRAFLESYPDDRMAADAQFWVGESLFTRGRFREAADEFLTGYNSYPQSAKRPETLLKLGQSLAGLGERATACETYAAVLRQFPQAPNAVRQQVQAEQASGRC